MARPVIALLCALALGVTGCSSHEPRFQATAPPAPERGPSEGLLDATARLITLPSARLTQLSPEALAALTSASAIAFEATGAPRARKLTRRYADALLEGRVPVGENLAGFGENLTGYYSEIRPGSADPGMTSTAGLALLDAWQATREPRYADAVRDAVAAVTSEELGWVSVADEAAVRERAVPRGRSISLTANAFLLLWRADRELGTEGADDARKALRTVDEYQAAVGRWYATVDPPRLPMRLDQWATTLFALSSSRRQVALAIAATGVPAMYSSVFDKSGRVLDADFGRDNPVGVALAVGVLTRHPDRALAERAYARSLKRLRSDGSVDLAPAGDLTAQAHFGLAFARRQASLKSDR